MRRVPRPGRGCTVKPAREPLVVAIDAITIIARAVNEYRLIWPAATTTDVIATVVTVMLAGNVPPADLAAVLERTAKVLRDGPQAPPRDSETVACNLCHGAAAGCTRCGGSGRLSVCTRCGCLAGRHEPWCKS